jgi:hypothetical protein
VDFENIKSLLLSSQDIKKFIRSKENDKEAMFLFWALDNLEQQKKDLSEESQRCLQINRKILEEAQQFIFSEELESSINKFSHGFVLGALE